MLMVTLEMLILEANGNADYTGYAGDGYIQWCLKYLTIALIGILHWVTANSNFSNIADWWQC